MGANVEWVQALKAILAETEQIKESQILCTLPVQYHQAWDNFMRGKTCPILSNGDHGVYGWDLKKFLQNY